MKSIRNLVISGMCLALCMVLPLLTGQIPQIGSMLAPMHLPVLLCGFVCGWPYGLAVGVVAPIMRYLLFAMPPMPTALAMAFELGTYGLLSGLLYRLFPRKPVSLYTTLLLSMLGGRLVWGGAMMLITSVNGGAFTFALFLSGAFVNAVPGIIVQIVLIPPIILALRKTNLISDAPTLPVSQKRCPANASSAL